jgi:hypothetical protein
LIARLNLSADDLAKNIKPWDSLTLGVHQLLS